MSEEEEYSLRRMEQEYLEAEQPKITRTSQNRAQNQPREEERAPKAAYRRKKHVKINWGAILIILITVAVIGVSAWQIIKNPTQLPNDGEGTNIGDVGGENETNPPIPDGTGEGETEPPEDIPLVMYDTRIHLNKYVDVGHQILVNNDRKYERVDSVETINAYSSRTYFTNEHIGQSVRIKVSGTSLGMDETAFRALEAMYAGLVADTGCDDLLITSGYRTVADQQGIWDRNLAQSGEDYTRSYVAIPGYSEHHTGLACDLSLYTDAGATIPLVDHEYGSWIWENCSDYGFILRYLKDKEDITHIAYEPWHFRYVGFPHAKAVEHFDVCFEEYIELIKKYTFETRMLYVRSDGTVSGADSEEMPTSDGYLIYYVPMAEGESTQIKIPAGFEYEDITISGNNVDGFIVTVYLYSSES
jgi:LAS superfamily LD-carboxypeptidase LdcB